MVTGPNRGRHADGTDAPIAERDSGDRHNGEMATSTAPAGSWWSDDGSGTVRIRVAARPGARRSEVSGVVGGELVVRVAAPPVEGAANVELARFVATALGVRRGAVTVERGAASRHKVLEVRGVESARVADLAPSD